MMRNLPSPVQEGVACETSGPPSRHPARLGRKLRTAWAPDGARLPGVWRSGWDLRSACFRAAFRARRHCCRERIPANVFQSCCCRRRGRPGCV